MELQLIAFIVSMVGLAAGGVWQLSRVEAALRKDIISSRDDVEANLRQGSREFGETVAAMRQKMADVELYASNHYVRRDGFFQVQTQLTEDIRLLGDKIETRFVRLEAKMDTKT